MDYTQIKVNVDERVGVITLNHNPPRNSFTKRMLVEVLDALDEFEKNDIVRCVMLNSEGPNFSMGADFDDIDEEWSGEGEIKETFSELGGKLVARVDFYPKPTLVAARGICFGGSAAVFSAFDIRIAGESFQMHDGDIYYGTVGSWGMASLRLPVWIGRNRIIIVSLLATFFIVLGRGAFGLVTEAVANGLAPASYFDMGADGIAAILITIVPISLASLCEQCTVQRITSAKSEKTSFRALILSVVIMIPCALMPAFIGMYGYVLFGDTTNSVFFKVALDVLPSFFAALLIAAVVAAIMSTIDTMFVAFSTIIMHNIYRGMINPNASEGTLKKGDFACHLFLTVGAAVIALQFSSILDLLGAMYRFCAACCFAPFIGGLFWKKGTSKGAIASTIVGFIYIALNMAGIVPSTTLLSIFSFLPAAVAYIIVSLLDKNDKKGNPEIASA